VKFEEKKVANVYEETERYSKQDFRFCNWIREEYTNRLTVFANNCCQTLDYWYSRKPDVGKYNVLSVQIRLSLHKGNLVKPQGNTYVTEQWTTTLYVSCESNVFLSTTIYLTSNHAHS
jgi:hypothetical protein